MNRETLDREAEIGRRLRAFREHLGITRTAFALKISIGSERLASYESGRVPLRYEVFSAMTKQFQVSPLWLATGQGGPRMDEPFDDSLFPARINPKARFSEVFESVLKQRFDDKSYEAVARMKRIRVELTKGLTALLEANPVNSTDGRDVDQVEELLAVCHAVVDEFNAGRSSQLGKKELTDTSEERKLASVKSPMKVLLAKVSALTKERGRKVALANYLHVNQSRVSEWLRGKVEPSGEVTLRLLDWIAGQEANIKRQ